MAIDLTDLSILAGGTFQDYVNFRSVPGNTVAHRYYKELKAQGQAEGLTNVVNHADYMLALFTNGTEDAVINNMTSEATAARQSVDY